MTIFHLTVQNHKTSNLINSNHPSEIETPQPYQLHNYPSINLFCPRILKYLIMLQKISELSNTNANNETKQEPTDKKDAKTQRNTQLDDEKDVIEDVILPKESIQHDAFATLSLLGTPTINSDAIVIPNQGDTIKNRKNDGSTRLNQYVEESVLQHYTANNIIIHRAAHQLRKGFKLLGRQKETIDEHQRQLMELRAHENELKKLELSIEERCAEVTKRELLTEQKQKDLDVREEKLNKKEARLDQSTSNSVRTEIQFPNKMLLVNLDEGNPWEFIKRLAANHEAQISPSKHTFRPSDPNVFVLLQIENLGKQIILNCNVSSPISTILWGGKRPLLSRILKQDWDAGNIPHVLNNEVQLFATSLLLQGDWVQVHGPYTGNYPRTNLLSLATVKELWSDSTRIIGTYDNDRCPHGSQCAENPNCEYRFATTTQHAEFAHQPVDTSVTVQWKVKVKWVLLEEVD